MFWISNLELPQEPKFLIMLQLVQLMYYGMVTQFHHRVLWWLFSTFVRNFYHDWKPLEQLGFCININWNKYRNEGLVYLVSKNQFTGHRTPPNVCGLNKCSYRPGGQIQKLKAWHYTQEYYRPHKFIVRNLYYHKYDDSYIISWFI